MENVTAQRFVEGILESIPKPWGPDILDQVFIAIENNPDWLDAYEKLVDGYGQFLVENSIGFNVMGLTGMKSLDRVHPARSRLIQNYTELGPDPQA